MEYARANSELTLLPYVRAGRFPARRWETAGMEEPLRLPAVAGAEPSAQGQCAQGQDAQGQDDVLSMSSTASATHGPVVLWITPA